jgi:hypothetical protein
MIGNRAECRLVAAMLFVITLSACGPQTRNDCILENMRGVTSDDAAIAIRNACNSKHTRHSIAPPKSECGTRPMTAKELAKLQIRARVKWEDLSLNYLTFSVYNGNNTSVEKMSVRIRDISFSAPQDYEVLGTRPLVRPSAAAQDLIVSVASRPSDDFRFQLLSAETCSE